MKTTTLFLVALVTLALTSCTEPATPAQITEAFTKAYESKDWETAKLNATKHGIEQLASAEKSLLGMFDDFTILGTNVNETVPREIEKIDCPENAELECDCKVTFTNKEEVIYKLVKEEEIWKVDFELSKAEQLFNNVTDFVDDAIGDEIDAAIDNVIDQGIDMVKDSVKNAMGL